MDIIVVPDTHGRPFAYQLSPFIESCDKIVFLGDYFDSFDYTQKQQIEEFEFILDLKRALGSKVELLLGNHDVQYLYPDRYELRCSGFEANPKITALLQDNKDNFSYCFQYKDWLFSHAGVSRSWINLILNKYQIENFTETAEKVASLLSYGFKEMYWCSKKQGGRNSIDGPLWERPERLVKDLPNFNQVVGHTYSPYHRVFDKLHVVDTGKISIYSL